MRRDILRSRTYAHPPERVWRALTDPEILAHWLMPNDFAPQVGHRFTFRTDPAPGFDGIVQSEVIELDPPSRLVLAWRGGGVDTTVSFELHPSPGGTTVVLHHAGFEGVRGVATSLVLGAGWRSLLRGKLADTLDALADGRDPAAARPASKGGGAWAWLAALLAPVLRRGA